MAISGLDHVQLAAPRGGEAKARWFFGELLGLVEVEKPDSLRARGGVWFTLGAQQLHIGIEDPFAPARKAHPGFRVSTDSLDAIAERLTSAGIPVTWDTDLPNDRRFYTSDPFGNRLEFLSPSA
ncbi:MAG: VOC family protein [Solirubrobacteraceae bacterium]